MAEKFVVQVGVKNGSWRDWGTYDTEGEGRSVYSAEQTFDPRARLRLVRRHEIVIETFNPES